MARDITLLTERNKEIRAAYNRLKCSEQIVNYKGRKVVFKPSYALIVDMLSTYFYLAPRTIMDIITATAPKMAEINSPTTSAAAA